MKLDKNAIVEFIRVTLLMFVYFVVVTYPLINTFTTSIPGLGVDAFNNSWSFWWVKHAVVDLKQNPFITHYLFYPFLVDITGELSVLYSILLLPVTIIFGYIASYNVRIALSFLLTGVTMYYCMKMLFEDKIIAFFSSAVFTFSYVRLSHMMVGHVDVISSEWLGLYLFFLFSLARNTKAQLHINIIGISALTLQAYTDYRNFAFMFHYTIVMMTVFLFVCYVYRLLSKWVIILRQIFVVWFFTLILIIPLIFLNSGIVKPHAIETHVENEWNASFQPLFVLPKSTLLSALMIGKPKQMIVSEGDTVYLGLIATLFAFIGVLLIIVKKRWGYWESVVCAVFIVYVLLTLGFWKMVYPWFSVFPLFAILRVPARFIIFAQLSLLIFSGYGLKYVLSAQREFYRFITVCILLVFSILENSFVPIAFLPQENYDAFSTIDHDPDTSVLEIPFEFGDIDHKIGGRNRRTFISQPIYEKPIIGGLLTWVNGSLWSVFEKDTLIKKMSACQEDRICEPLTYEELQRFTKFYKIKYMVIRDIYKNSNMENYLVRQISVALIYQNDNIKIYRNSFYE